MLSAVFAVAVWLGPPLEQPVATELALDWNAPSSCPQRDAVTERIQLLVPELGPIGEVSEPAAIRVFGRIDLADGERWDVSLRFDSERGVDERRFSGPDCVALADAAALVIAVALDPLATSITLEQRAVEPEPEPESEPEPEPASEPALESTNTTLEQADAYEVRRNARFALAVLGGGGYGPLTLGHGTLGLELAAFGPRWRASVRARWLAPTTRQLADGDTGRFDGFGVAARGCGVPSVGRVEFPICVGLEAGGLRGSSGTRVASLPWVAIVAGPGLRWAIRERFALALDLDLLVPVVRGGFTIGDSIATEFSPIGGQVLAGVELRLP